MKILVVDDEAPARAYLADLVRKLGPPWELVGEAADGAAAVERCRAEPVDLVLMDIRMPGMDGLEAARRLSRMEVPPAVIFTTAYAEHALPAFEVKASGYLLKPVRPEKLRRALEEAARPTRPLVEREGTGPWITVRFRGNLERIPLEEVYYFRADSKYVAVRHSGGEALIEDSLRSLEERFGNRLMRIHRNALVVPERVRGLERGAGGMAVVFDGIGERLDVSRRHLPAVRRRLRGEGAA